MSSTSTTRELARRIASHFDSRFLRGYARGKIGSDPAYAAVFDRVAEMPLLDVGCGIGLLSFYLRERGFRAPIDGLDHDAKKIAAANAIAARYEGLTFRTGDAREPLAFRGSVILLDLLHYFDDATQTQILRNAAACVPPGGAVIVRDALRDDSWRYRITYAQESFARGIRWLKAERLNFPTRATLVGAFDGFAIEERPLWGATPFNNYLFVFRRPSSGITNE
ncbi:MAG TPA: class I SAM-dependent methyltransferase [Thermoanaerobaculia bacterium]|nr:class I SAM-dependent methyltransferase [Thermoanaerobaculia bacterium]